jgi:membrane-associated protein
MQLHAEAPRPTVRCTSCVADVLRFLGVWAIFAFAALDAVGLPASGDAAVVLAAAHGDTSLGVVVLLGFAGALVGDHVVYWAGRIAGTTVVPRLVGIERQERLRGALDRHAALTLAGGRLVTAIRSEVAFLAGAARLSYARFAVWNAVGCLVWAVLATLAGRMLGQLVDVEPLLRTVERWSALLAGALVATLAAVLGVRLVRARRNPQRDPSARR